MTARRIRLRRSRLLGTGVALAALLTATSATGASALWSAASTASLSVTGAAFGASSSSPTVVGSSYTGPGPYTGTVEVLFPVSATSGSMPWTAAKVELTGTGAVAATGATTSVTGLGVTSTGSCAGVSYGSGGTSAQLTALNGLADGGSRGVCVQLGITGLTAASNNTFATIGMTVTAVVGPSSVDGTGWTASAPPRSVNVSMPLVPEAATELPCTQYADWVVGITVDPARNAPVAQHLGSPTGPTVDYLHGSGPVDELWLYADQMPNYASDGVYTIYVVGADGEVWGTFEVLYVSSPETLLCAGVN